MKKTLKMFTIVLAFLILSCSNIRDVYSEEKNKSATILFTHDLHDHLYPFNSLENDKSVSRGGYARLSTAIKKEKSIDPELILVDGGDFSMGTLFQTIFTTASPELRIMGKMGYDVTTFGNHEFDFREEGLADSLIAAKESGDKLPQIVTSNISFPLNKDGELTPSLEQLNNSMDDYGVKDYTVINRGGVKIGVFGLLGEDAQSHSPMSEVSFYDSVKKSKEIVHILKNEEKVDLIVCLSHSGTTNKKSQSEDETLAKKVPEIDVIVSGHTHSSFEKPIIIGNTIIGSVGQYGENLGKLNITQNSNKRWDLTLYELKRIDDSLDMDTEVLHSIDSFKQIVQDDYLDRFDMGFDEVLARTPFNLTDIPKLGYLISDSYEYAVKQAERNNSEPVAVTIVPYGMIRASFIKGDITSSQVFTVSPLGIGPDKVSGYPLISVYLSGKELKTIAEIDASIKIPAEVDPSIDLGELYMNGLHYTFNPNRLIFDKITDVYLISSEGKRLEVDDDKLYRVVTSLYSAQMLDVVGKKSFDLLSVIPKTKDGNPITDFEDHIIYDGDNELKEWLALGKYLSSFPKENNISLVPEHYDTIPDRKTIDDDNSLYSKFKNPNLIWLSVYGILGLIMIVVISVVVVFFSKRRNNFR